MLIGVVAAIYDLDPNGGRSACIKAGNAVILKGGSEATHSNASILNVCIMDYANTLPQMLPSW